MMTWVMDAEPSAVDDAMPDAPLDEATRYGSVGESRARLRGLLGKASGYARLIGTGLVDAILPPLCAGCRVPVDRAHGICGTCWSEISFIEPPICDRLGTPFAHDPGGRVDSTLAVSKPPVFDRARAVARHDGLAREIVHSLKYGDRLETTRLMARLMQRAGAELIADADLIVPVPLHWRRMLGRRFNQSAELARVLARHTDIRYAPEILLRKRSTRQQVGLTAKQRQANVRSAFVVPDEMIAKVSGQHVLLIDDVLTTGATVDAAAKSLQRAGASAVDILVFTRVVGEAIEPI